jgi:hypothetical protein
LHINRFAKSPGDGAGDLLGVAEHRLIDHESFIRNHFLSATTSGLVRHSAANEL